MTLLDYLPLKWKLKSTHREPILVLGRTCEDSYWALLSNVQKDVWFEAVSRYEPVEVNGRSFRLSINQHFEVIGKAQLQTAK